jgi:hypothetical protein
MPDDYGKKSSVFPVSAGLLQTISYFEMASCDVLVRVWPLQ